MVRTLSPSAGKRNHANESFTLTKVTGSGVDERKRGSSREIRYKSLLRLVAAVGLEPTT